MKKKAITLFILSLMFGILGKVQAQSGKWDVYKYGAKGDGLTLDTRSIQNAIDDCSSSGGGIVELNRGIFLSGTIFLKSNVSLSIEQGAVLLGSEDVKDYSDISSSYPTYAGDSLTSKALIYAEDVENISITGLGIIDGNGEKLDKRKSKTEYLSPSFKYRPRIIYFQGIRNLRIYDITLKNSGSWVQTYQRCENMIIDRLTVNSRENPDISNPVRHYAVAHRNTDGLDIVDCQNVHISNSFINSGDDAICIKSFSPDGHCRNIVVNNCIVSSNASGIKIGTETSGKIEDIIIQNCVVYDTRGEGIGIMTVDGAKIERVNISNITLRNIKRGAIFIRLGTRNRTYGNNREINNPSLKDIIIENIQGTQISKLGCSITGLETYRPERIILRNINLEFDGGVMDYDKHYKVPELANGYPKGDMFGDKLPAYGFYIRHVDKIVLENTNLHLKEKDIRPAVLCEDVKNIRIKDFNKWSDDINISPIVFQNVSGIEIADKELEYLKK